MDYNFFNGSGLWGQPGFAIGLGIIAMIWSIFWKGLALWKSARLGHKKWFIVLLLINTIGILEIFYIYVWSKRQHHRVPHPNDHQHRNGGHIAEGSKNA